MILEAVLLTLSKESRPDNAAFPYHTVKEGVKMLSITAR